MNQIARCRVVITGSYHAGVFALSQGIPVVAIVNSDYYSSKFIGLADQFGGGVEIVDLKDKNPLQKLELAIYQSISMDKKAKERLIEKAHQQVSLSSLAWKNFLENV